MNQSSRQNAHCFFIGRNPTSKPYDVKLWGVGTVTITLRNKEAEMAEETKQMEKQEEPTLADEQQETTKANEKKKEADGKYTDEQVNEIINRKFAEW